VNEVVERTALRGPSIATEGGAAHRERAQARCDASKRCGHRRLDAVGGGRPAQPLSGGKHLAGSVVELVVRIHHVRTSSRMCSVVAAEAVGMRERAHASIARLVVEQSRRPVRGAGWASMTSTGM
jgi:hypothetical protein